MTDVMEKRAPYILFEVVKSVYYSRSSLFVFSLSLLSLLRRIGLTDKDFHQQKRDGQGQITEEHLIHTGGDPGTVISQTL